MSKFTTPEEYLKQAYLSEYGDDNVQALTDGLLLLRYLFGFEGDTLIGGAVSGSATRTTADEVKSYIESRITTVG